MSEKLHNYVKRHFYTYFSKDRAQYLLTVHKTMTLELFTYFCTYYIDTYPPQKAAEYIGKLYKLL